MGVAAHALPPVSHANPPVFQYLPPSSAVVWFTLISSLVPSVRPQGPTGQMLLLRAGIYSDRWVPQGIGTILSLCPPHTTTLLYSSVWSAHLRRPLRSASLRPFSTTFTLAFLRGFISARCSALPCLLRLLIRYKAAICHIVLPVWENIYIWLVMHVTFYKLL